MRQYWSRKRDIRPTLIGLVSVAIMKASNVVRGLQHGRLLFYVVYMVAGPAGVFLVPEGSQ